MGRTFCCVTTAAWAFLLLSIAGFSGCADEATPGEAGDDEGDTSKEEPSSSADEDEDGSDEGANKDAGSKKSDASVDAGKSVADAGKKDAGGNLIDAGAGDTLDRGDAGSAAPDSAQPDDKGEAEDLGQGDGKDVITIGDSWMNLTRSSGIEVSLEKISGRDYRNFGVSGTKLLDEVIPKQYEAAKSADPDIKTVVMTGGGNDILQVKLLDCIDSSFGDVCKAQIDLVAARLVKLWDEMSDDGVRDVIIVGYTTKANVLGTLVKSAMYSNEKIPPLCAAVKPPLRCHAVDSDLLFDGKLRDGIHPTDAGYDAIGKGVWELMQKEGMRR